MVYITVKQSPMYRQMTLEEFLFASTNESSLITSNDGNTRTYRFDQTPFRLAAKVNKRHLIGILAKFNEQTDPLRQKKREDLYYSFFIPKRSGGKRRIDAPNIELMDALRDLKRIFEVDFGALYHTTAFAYIKGRCTVDALKRHQNNESRWFGKFDLSNFFGSTTLEFVMNQLSMIYPFSEIIKDERGRNEMRKALDLAFLNGGLPQGTPFSPTITNIMMIPIDYMISNALRDFDGKKFVYTRYADDFIISCRYDFKFRDIESLVINTLNDFDAPFSLNREKTRYGSSAGRNFNLGLMITADNKITIGRAKKKRLETLLYDYANCVKNGTRWALEDVQVLSGQISYYRMVEHEVIDNIIAHISRKQGVDILKEMKSDLK